MFGQKDQEEWVYLAKTLITLSNIIKEKEKETTKGKTTPKKKKNNPKDNENNKGDQKNE